MNQNIKLIIKVQKFIKEPREILEKKSILKE